MAAESSDQLNSPSRHGVFDFPISIPVRDYMREFVGTQMAIMEARLTSVDVLQKQSSDSSQRAIQKAEEQMNNRLQTMNQFREQLQHQAATFITNQHFEETIKALEKASGERKDALGIRLQAVEAIISNWQGRLVVLGAGWAILVIFISALVNYTIRAATEPHVISAPAVVSISPTK